MTPVTINHKLSGLVRSPWLPPLIVLLSLLWGEMALRVVAWLYLVHFIFFLAPGLSGQDQAGSTDSQFRFVERFVSFSGRWGWWVVGGVSIMIVAIILTHKLGA